jgi:hypothetical protein
MYMKLTTGLKWGLVVGIIIGIVSGVVAYMSVVEVLPQLVEYTYQQLVNSGQPEVVARQAVELLKETAPIMALIGGVFVSVVLYLIVGLIMAAVWERLNMPWYAKGALFGVVLVAIFSLPSLLTPPPQDLPAPPAAYQYVSAALYLTGPILLAWFLRGRE